MSAALIAGTLALGLVFGFVLQRGGFCGSALLSTAVLERDAPRVRHDVAIGLSVEESNLCALFDGIDASVNRAVILTQLSCCP